MAVTGFLMLAFVLVHMIGNLKIYFGRAEFDSYSEWLRTLGSPALPHSGYLWIQRFALVVIVVVHMLSAYILTRRDHKARPIKYQHRSKQRSSYAVHTMRWGGVIIILFVIYHILDLSTLTINPNGERGEVYRNVVADFQLWYVTLFYVLAMLALGIHIDHGFWSAAQTLGVSKPRTERVLKTTARVLAIVLTVGFIVVPVSVYFGALA